MLQESDDVPETLWTAGETVYQTTMDKCMDLEEAGYKVEQLWECELKRELEADAEMDQFFHQLRIQDPMDPRDAFFGGRTNATKLWHKCEEGEKIQYIDVCSLYPWVCKYGKFPIHHPEIITENIDLEGLNSGRRPYEGLIRCCVLPPRGLLHPVLPLRIKDKDGVTKLMFTLCKICGTERSTKGCQHSEERRCFWGAWVTDELYHAVKRGYVVLEVSEVWHFKTVVRYNGTDPESGLFTEFINLYLQMKQQASGWPAWCKTEEQKAQYIREYEEHEGIKLEPDKVEKNSALRASAKLMLNSFWGKFGQRNNLMKTDILDNYQSFIKILNDDTSVPTGMTFLSEYLVQINYKKLEEFEDELPNTNPVIAAYTTAQARLKLLDYIEDLQERVLYFDTDSIIYLTRPEDQYEPPTGDFLGDMQDELREYGEGSYIREFVSTGPKSYAYTIWSSSSGKEVEVVKSKGIPLKGAAESLIQLSMMKDKVEKFVSVGLREMTSIPLVMICKRRHHVYTKKTEKIFRVTYDKRRILPDFNTVPFGY